MSIEVVIFPTIQENVTWYDIRVRWQQHLGDAALALLGAAPQMIDISDRMPLTDHEGLVFECSYCFDLPQPNTLGVMLFPNVARYISERDFLEDYGRNLSAAQIEAFIEQWQMAGHHYEITSFAGRGPHEPRMFTALAIALAEACQGYIIVMNDTVFNLDVGLYTPQEICHTQPKFKSLGLGGVTINVSAGGSLSLAQDVLPNEMGAPISLAENPSTPADIPSAVQSFPGQAGTTDSLDGGPCASSLPTKEEVIVSDLKPMIFDNVLRALKGQFTFRAYKNFLNKHGVLEYKRISAIRRGRCDPPGQIGEELYINRPLRYRRRLPVYLLARCPICGGRVWEAVDTYSLMGLGWRYNGSRGFGWYGRLPAKKYVNTSTRHTAMTKQPEASYLSACEHVCAVTYGVNLNGIAPTDVVSWHVEIGSERPGVLHPFIAKNSCYAVMHTLPIGRYDDAKRRACYTAHFMTYFAKDKADYLASLAPQNPQDQDFYWPYDQMDYQLDKWVDAGKLAWLDAEQRALPLKTGPVHEFPYGQMAGLEGRWKIEHTRLERIPITLTGWRLLTPRR